jgi:hypothetical protein
MAQDWRDLRQTEIENLGMSALGEEDIRRLDIPVDNACGMSGIECVGDLDPEGQSRFDLQRLATDSML